MTTFARRGLTLSYVDAGTGPPFVFQHGLGGDAAQPTSQAPVGCRLITLECRGHGASPLGPEEELGFETFARDLSALMDELRVPRTAVGGISMGAGVALRLAHLRPDQVNALVLVRPAWLDRPQPPNLRAYREISALLRDHPADEAKARFMATSAYQRIVESSPSAAASLVAQFDKPGARERAAVFARLPDDCPLPPGAEWASISMPTLLVGARHDSVHPFEYAEQIHDRLPNATLVEVPPKERGDAEHREAVANAIGRFLGQLDLEESEAVRRE